MPVALGFVGFGTVCEEIARAVRRGEAGDARLACALVKRPERARELSAEEWGYRFTADPEEFFAQQFDVAVEAAGHDAIREHAERVLRSGRDLVMCSVGAFADDELFERVRRAASESGKRVIVPSGGIAGLDRITSGMIGGLDEVTLSVSKAPAAWKGTAGEAKALGSSERVLLYEGSAREAARTFPQNVNIAAALALAGIGLDRTMVKVYSDPGITHITNEIYARGAFGDLRVQIRNVPSSNPKTSAVIAMTMIKAIKQLTAPVLVGV